MFSTPYRDFRTRAIGFNSVTAKFPQRSYTYLHTHSHIHTLYVKVKGKAVGVEGVSDLPLQGPALAGRWPVSPSPPYRRSSKDPVYSSQLSGLEAPLNRNFSGAPSVSAALPAHSAVMSRPGFYMLEGKARV